MGYADEGRLNRGTGTTGPDPHRRNPRLWWLVLSRGANDSGTISMLFEFERQACVDIYSLLIAAGLDLSQSAHIRFTELCQCTRSHQKECGAEIASIDLEIQTFPVEMVHGSAAHHTA